MCLPGTVCLCFWRGPPSSAFGGVGGFALVGGSYDNGSHDGCFTVNLNNAVSNSNANNGGSLYLIQGVIDDFNYSFIALYIPYPLVKITLNKKRD